MCSYFFPVGRYPTIQKNKNFNQATVSFAFITSGTEGIFTGLGGFTGTTGFSSDSLGFLGLSLEVSMVVSCNHQKMPWFESHKKIIAQHMDFVPKCLDKNT